MIWIQKLSKCQSRSSYWFTLLELFISVTQTAKMILQGGLYISGLVNMKFRHSYFCTLEKVYSLCPFIYFKAGHTDTRQSFCCEDYILDNHSNCKAVTTSC